MVAFHVKRPDPGVGEKGRKGKGNIGDPSIVKLRQLA